MSQPNLTATLDAALQQLARELVGIRVERRAEVAAAHRDRIEISGSGVLSVRTLSAGRRPAEDGLRILAGEITRTAAAADRSPTAGLTPEELRELIARQRRSGIYGFAVLWCLLVPAAIAAGVAPAAL